MDNATFTEEARADAAALLGLDQMPEIMRAAYAEDRMRTINAEIARAREELAAFPPMMCGKRSTERMLAFGNLAHWMAKKIQFERGQA